MVIGAGKLTSTSGMGLNIRPGTNTVVAELTFGPNSSTGWHSHPGKTLVTVQQGTFTVYHDNCHPHVYEAGDAFVELPSSVHVGRNETGGTVKIGVVFTNVPIGGSFRGSISRSLRAATRPDDPRTKARATPARAFGLLEHQRGGQTTSSPARTARCSPHGRRYRLVTSRIERREERRRERQRAGWDHPGHHPNREDAGAHRLVRLLQPASLLGPAR